MSNYLFSGILIVSSFAIGWMLYFVVAVLIKRRGVVSLKLLKVNLGLLKSPLRLLIPALCVSVVIPFLRFSSTSP